jgi:Flp pilus assembly protein TadB
VSGPAAGPLLAILCGAVAGGGVFLLFIGLRGLRPQPPGTQHGAGMADQLRGIFGPRGAVAALIGVAALVATRWVVAGVGVAILAYSWRGLSGAASERRAMARLEGLAIWTESLRDTIAGAVGLEQAIPASLRVAAPSLAEPLTALVSRMHTRVPLPDALRVFADDLDDPGADLIVAALIINSRLRGPGLRDLLGSLSASVREELDMRRKVGADRRSTRRSVQIVVLVSVGLALVLALFDHGFLAPYDGPFGQLLLVIVAAIYAAGIVWLRRLAHFEAPQRLLSAWVPEAQAGPAAPAASTTASAAPVAGSGP